MKIHTARAAVLLLMLICLTVALPRLTFAGASKVEGPELIVENVRFPSSIFCSLVQADITNVGDAEQPFGWSITYSVPKLGVISTFEGQQPLAPGETLVFFHNPEITTPGRFRVVISVDDGSDEGQEDSAKRKMVLPCD